ncbi:MULTISPECIES: hypothetical protein [unclassified Streptomyces]|uniref:hypothetical protein n=1 Tax=unclassified Streptomyces TaxID=2593676 RepID=UPI00133158A8|nr:hypothetical protein [Streptomyces sp. SAT1]
MNEVTAVVNPINLVDLAKLFESAVSSDAAKRRDVLESVPAAERTRIGRVLGELLASPEDERMLRLPMTDTDMVDFEIAEEVGHG